MKKLLLGLLLCGLASSAFAACPSPLTGKDAAGTTQNFQITTDSTGNNCIGTVSAAMLNNASLASWTSATGGTTNIDIPFSGQFPNVIVNLDYGVLTSGAVTFRGLKANGSYETIPVAQVLNKSTYANLTNAYSLVPGGQTGAAAQDFLILTNGYQKINVQLSTVIVGGATLVVSYILPPYNSIDNSLINPSPGITPVKFDQTTPGTTNGVVNNPTSASGSALTGTSCGSAVSSCVLKASAGNFYSTYAECTSACWLMVFNSTSAPSNGATTAGNASGNLVECVDIAAASARSISYPVFPRNFSVGITVAISSTACATLTLSTVGFISGSVL